MGGGEGTDNGAGFRVYWQRWVMLGYMSLLNLLSDWTCYSVAPISILTQEAFGDIDPERLVVVFLGANAVASALEPAILARLGLRRTVLFGALLLMIGSVVKSGGLPPIIKSDLHKGHDEWRLYLGFFLVGLSQPLYQCTPALLSASWFPEKERTMATGVALNANQLGIGVAFVFGTLLVSDSDDIPNYFGLLSIVSTIAFMGTPIQFDDAPPTPPSDTARVMRGSFEVTLPSINTIFESVRGLGGMSNSERSGDSATDKAEKALKPSMDTLHESPADGDKATNGTAETSEPESEEPEPEPESEPEPQPEPEPKSETVEPSPDLNVGTDGAEHGQGMGQPGAPNQPPQFGPGYQGNYPFGGMPMGAPYGQDPYGQGPNSMPPGGMPPGGMPPGGMPPPYGYYPPPYQMPPYWDPNYQQQMQQMQQAYQHQQQQYYQYGHPPPHHPHYFYQQQYLPPHLQEYENPQRALPAPPGIDEGAEPLVTFTPHHLDIDIRDDQVILSIRACMARPGFIHSLVAFTVSGIVINTLSTFMDFLVRLNGAPRAYVGIVGGLFQFMIMVSSLIVGSQTDKTRAYYSVIIGMLVLGAFGLAECGVSLDADRGSELRWALVIVAVLVGPLQPVSTELGVDVAYPLSENTVLVIQQLFSNLLSAIFIPCFKAMKDIGTVSFDGTEEYDRPEYTFSFYLLIVLHAAATVFFATFNGRYLRYEHELQKAEAEEKRKAGVAAKAAYGANETLPLIT